MSGDLTFETVRDTARFLALEQEWDDLWRRTAQQRFTHRFIWFRLGWETTGLPRKRQMHVLVVRRGGRAVLIWPLALVRRMFWLQAIALGAEFTEYEPILVEDGPDAVELIGSARRRLSRTCPASLIEVHRARVNSAVEKAMAIDVTALPIESLGSPYIALTGFPNWEAYWQSRSRNVRHSYSRRWRKLTELGEVTFERERDPDEVRRLVAWTLERKVAWMKRTGHENSFMRTPEFAEFLCRAITCEDEAGAVLMYVLRLDGRTIATKIGTIDGRRFEGYVSTYEPDFGTFSIGTIVLVEALKQFIDRGLNYDQRIGEEAYKQEWATDDRPVTSYCLVNRFSGRLLLAAGGADALRLNAFNWLRKVVPLPIRTWVKSRLGR